MNQEERNELINYRISQANETISDVELLLQFKKYRSAVSRIYYGMFYALLALGLKYEFETSKHQQLIGWFNKEFINVGKIDIKFGKMIRNAFKDRQKSDYETNVEFLPEQVDSMLSDMKFFISEIESFVKNK